MKIKKAHEQLMENTLNEATRSLGQLDYPLHLVRADEFVKEKQLMRHEVLRNMHRLTVLDNLVDVEAFMEARNQVVFFSHQWTAFDVPDPNNTQYEAMVDALHELAKQTGWDSLEPVFVWVDYSCIPQANRSIQNLAIRSLAVYASSATHFVVIAPDTPHTNVSDMVCDLDTYQRRMWCRAEQVCHSMRNGTDGMFLATTKPGDSGDVNVCAVRPDFFRDSLRVFDGELTCCRFEHKGMESCDRQSLVVPILGLYGELYRAAYEGGKEGGANMSVVKDFLEKIETQQEAIFPRTFKRVMWRKNKRITEEVLLFGDLIERMRERIKKGKMYVLQERGGTESSKSEPVLTHGSNFIRHGHGGKTEQVVDIPRKNFARHGSVELSKDEAAQAATILSGKGTAVDDTVKEVEIATQAEEPSHEKK